MAVHPISDSDGFAQLVAHPNDRNRELGDVAADFVATHTTHPRPDTIDMIRTEEPWRGHGARPPHYPSTTVTPSSTTPSCGAQSRNGFPLLTVVENLLTEIE